MGYLNKNLAKQFTENIDCGVYADATLEKFIFNNGRYGCIIDAALNGIKLIDRKSSDIVYAEKKQKPSGCFLFTIFILFIFAIFYKDCF
ncbi:MAG: hypothetical protein RRZ70_03215 [Synergistaceae bacterium]